jgi:hypothetical protein
METTRSPIAHARDPVALVVERELKDLAQQYDVEASLNPPDDGNVELRFDNIVVSAESQDIALLRLASALLNEERYMARLTQTLGPQLNPHVGSLPETQE